MQNKRDISQRRALRPKAKPYDEIRITTVPYFKRSHASGSVWRTTQEIRIMRKGKIIDTICYNKSGWMYIDKVLDILTPFTHALTSEKNLIGEGSLCDQEGCSQLSTVCLKMKKNYDNEAVQSDPYVNDKRPLIRKFCNDHCQRGDSSYEDADDNYDEIKNTRSHVEISK